MTHKKRFPCQNWCEGRLRGIVENLKLRGELDEEFQVEFVPLRGLRWVPADTFILKCEHGRQWQVKDVTPAR